MRLHSVRVRARVLPPGPLARRQPSGLRRLRGWLGSLALALACSNPSAALAASGEEDAIAALRRDVAAMRADYEARIAQLEARLATAESALQTAAAGPASAAPEPMPTAAPAAASSASAFNPAISAILQGRAAAIGGPDGSRDIPGFLLGGEAGVGPEGLSLGETELALSANADDKFFGLVTVSLAADDGETEVELEEAYLQTLALPAGFTLRAGQFFSGIGYQNGKHSHAWDFVDQPLAYEALLGGQLRDAGAQLSWVAPTDTYLQLGAELLRGESFPAGGAAHDGLGAWSLFGRVSGELGASNTWQAGVSYLSANPRGRASEDRSGRVFDFSGDSDVWIAAFVWKWAPQGNFRERNLVFQTELLHRHERGALDVSGLFGTYQGDQDGVYVQAAYQFVPRWRVGLRYDRLWSDDTLTGIPASWLPDDEEPSRVSAMLDFSNSEFSRLRLQWNHQWGGLDGDDAIFLQYILSVGSHGAHEF
ncbi:MAG TPA: hypothetical protein VII78_19210 [Myxococcota bacterium]|jgi:hypothetical protein